MSVVEPTGPDGTPSAQSASASQPDAPPDRLLRPALVGTVALVAVFLVGIPHPVLQVALGWTVSAGYLSAAAVFSARAARRHRGEPARRFWLSMCIACGLFATGNLLQLLPTVRHPNEPTAIESTPAAAACGALAALVIIGVMLTYPVPMRTRSARTCFWLDVSTVMAAAATFGAYAGTVNSLPTSGTLGTWTLNLVAGPLVLLLALFGVVKLLLGGTPPFTRVSGLLGAAAAGLSGLSSGLAPTLSADNQHWFFAVGTAANALLMASARTQETGVQPRGAWFGRRKGHGRNYSVLPYLAVTAAYALVFVDLHATQLSVAQWSALIGATTCTAMVILRQLAAFADNERLLRERDCLTNRLQFQAYHDTLTGLANRALFFDRLEVALAASARSGRSNGVLLIDLDDFKPINDRYGHDVGDAVLVAAGARMSAQVRPSDTVARVGGDEFAVLLVDIDAAQLTAIAARIERAVREPHLVGDVATHVGASIGASLDHRGTRDAAALVKAADEAMYLVKARGKSGIQFEAQASGLVAMSPATHS